MNFNCRTHPLFLAGTLAVLGSAASIRGRGAGYLFLEEPVGVRSIGMGSAGTALGGTGAGYYNPAGALFSPRPAVAVEYGGGPEEYSHGSIEFVLRRETAFFGCTVPTAAVDGFGVTTEQGLRTGETFSVQGSAAMLFAGYVRDSWAAALGVNGIVDRVYTYSYYAVSFSAGAGWWCLPGRCALGAAVFHPNRLTVPGSESIDVPLAWSRSTRDNPTWGEGPPLPTGGRVGIGWTDTVSHYPWRLAADIVYRDETEKVTVPVGVEACPAPWILLRCGSRIGHDTERFNAGIGLHAGPLAMDGAVIISRWESDSVIKWILGIRYTLL